MNRLARLALGAALLAAAFAPLTGAPADEMERTRRFALVIGANYGGPGRDRLRYAVSDARAIVRVLESLGGVLPDDSRLLVEPDRETCLWEIERLRERVSRARSGQRRLEVLVYYSGHSDDSGLLLGRERIPYRELRERLDALVADVRIAVLDSCASGAFIRAKGGQRQPPFLFDGANDMKGFAVLTSSSADEASQESERVRGSFFTHHLLTGLRGAADASRDGRITLSEAYQYAFGETLRQTERSVNGPQHPSYNIQMSGTGDVVLTELRHGDARLLLERDVAGKVFVHDQANALVMEFPKAPGGELQLALERGRYRLVTVSDGDIQEATVELASGETRALSEAQFSRTTIIDAIARGDRQADREGLRAPRRPLHAFVGFYGKTSRYEGHWSFMPGMQFGVTISPALACGLIGYGKTATESYSRPPFWGLAVDFTLLERNRLRFIVRTVAGLMYRNQEEELERRMSLVLEPGVGLAWAISPRLRAVAQLSLDFVNGTNDNLRRFSCGLGLEFGKR